MKTRKKRGKEKEEKEGKKRKDEQSNMYIMPWRVQNILQIIQKLWRYGNMMEKQCEENVVCCKVEWNYNKQEY